MNRKPKTVGAYADCIQILDKALQAKGLRIKFDRAGTAVNFQQRCYRARRILQEASVQKLNQIPFSAYDALYIKIEPKPYNKDEPAELVFRLHDAGKMDGAITDLDGNPVELENDAFAEQAKKLADRLILE